MKYDIKLKNDSDIKHLRESCRRLSVALKATAAEVRPGITTGYLNDFFHKLVIDGGDTPAFLNYQPFGADYPYPGSICISVNDEVVHGIPRPIKLKADSPRIYPGIESMTAKIEYESVCGRIWRTIIVKSDSPNVLAART